MIYPGDAPSAFRIPISRVRSSTAVYMERQTTRNPISTATPDHHVREGFDIRNAVGAEQRDKLLDRIDLVGGKVFFEGLLDGAGIGRIVELDVDGGNQTARGEQLLQRPDIGEGPGELTLLDDAGDFPAVGELDRTARLKMVLAGEDFIHYQVIRALKGTSFEKLEAAAHRVEFVQMNSGDGIEAVDLLYESARGHRDVRLPADNVDDLFRHREREGEPGTVRRTDENIRTGPAGSGGHIIQHAAAEADQRQNQRNLDANGEDAQQGPHRTVLQIFENQTIDQRSILPASHFSHI